MGDRVRYRALLVDGRLRTTLAWSIVGRTPLSMLPLGLVLLTRSSGAGYGPAAIVGASYAIALALTTPAAARAVDRRGPRRAMLIRAAGFSAATAAVCASAAAGAPVAALAGCAALMGVTMPPVTASTRAAWRGLAPTPSSLAMVMSLDATAHEIVFICGPALVAALAALSSILAIAIAGVAGVLGTLGFVAARAGDQPRPPAEPGRSLGGALAGTGMRTLFGAALAMGFAVGALETSMPAFAEHHGNRALGGVAIACFAAGSGVGGILSGWLSATDTRRRVLVAAALTPFALALPLVAGSLEVMYAAVLLAGLPLAAVLSGAYALVDTLAPAGTQTEAFGWLSTALYAGGAAGTALAGQLIASGGSARSLLAAAAAGVACGAVALLGRGSLLSRRLTPAACPAP